jgi:hypothetical protein
MKKPRQRLHNPEGGGYKPTTQPHKLKKDKKPRTLEEKILRKGKINLTELKKLLDL